MTSKDILDLFLQFEGLWVIDFKNFLLLIFGNILSLPQGVLLDIRLKWLISKLEIVIIGTVCFYYLNFLHRARCFRDEILHAVVQMVLDGHRHLLFELPCCSVRWAINIILLNMKLILELLGQHVWLSFIKISPGSRIHLNPQLVFEIPCGYCWTPTTHSHKTMLHLWHFLRSQYIRPMSHDWVLALVYSDLLNWATVISYWHPLGGVLGAFGVFQKTMQNIFFLSIPIILHPLSYLLDHIPLLLISHSHENWFMKRWTPWSWVSFHLPFTFLTASKTFDIVKSFQAVFIRVKKLYWWHQFLALSGVNFEFISLKSRVCLLNLWHDFLNALKLAAWSHDFEWVREFISLLTDLWLLPFHFTLKGFTIHLWHFEVHLDYLIVYLLLTSLVLLVEALFAYSVLVIACFDCHIWVFSPHFIYIYYICL